MLSILLLLLSVLLLIVGCGFRGVGVLLLLVLGGWVNGILVVLVLLWWVVGVLVLILLLWGIGNFLRRGSLRWRADRRGWSRVHDHFGLEKRIFKVGVINSKKAEFRKNRNVVKEKRTIF